MSPFNYCFAYISPLTGVHFTKGDLYMDNDEIMDTKDGGQTTLELEAKINELNETIAMLSATVDNLSKPNEEPVVEEKKIDFDKVFNSWLTNS